MSLTKLDDAPTPVHNELSKGSLGGSLTSISQSEEALLKNCYSCPDDVAFKAFRRLQSFIKESIIEGTQSGDYDAFDPTFFERLRRIAVRQSAIKQVECAKVIITLFSNDGLLDKFLTEEKNKEVFTDYINLLLTMLDKFDQLPLCQKLGEITRKLVQGIIDKGIFSHDKEYFQNIINDDKLNPHQLTLNDHQKKMLENISSLSTSPDCLFKKDISKLIISVLEDGKSFVHQIRIFNEYIGPLLKDIMSIKNGTEDQIQLFVEQMFQIVEKFIFQLEYSVSYERNKVYETKFFAFKDEKQLIAEHPALLKNVAIILNAVLLRPFEINLQLKTFYIIRRLYYLFPQYAELIINPLNLVLSNISIYSSQPAELKEATIFLYQIMHKENEDHTLKRLVEENENLKYLKESKYFSVKAMSYPKDIDTIYPLKNLNIEIGLPVKMSIEAGKILTYSFYVEENESIIFWKFKVKGYNIRFGIYRIKSLDSTTYQNIETDTKNYEEVIKMQKVEASETFMTGSTLLTSPGYYKVFFDNTYSIWRGKDLEFNIHVLIPI